MRISPARQAALAFLQDESWLEGGDWDELVAARLGDPLLSDPRDRRLFSHLVSGCVRLRGRLDARLRRLCAREDFDPVVLSALRLALYQLEEMDRMPAHAVVAESVEWVRLRRGARLAGWLNAQLRQWQREGIPGADPDPEADPLAYGVEVLSYPPWLVKRWLAELGAPRALALMAAMNDRSHTDFRWNALRDGQAEFLARIRRGGARVESLEMQPRGFRVHGAWPEGLRDALAAGALSVQDEASQRVVPLLLAPGCEGPLADLCAAPGGKAAQMAELSGDAREILALDRSPRRLDKVVANARRLGLSRIRAEAADLLEAEARPSAGVLLDAPCSALGVLAANPDARWRKSEALIVEQAGLQRQLLEAAARWVIPGGRLIYSVCTLTPEETGDQKRWFLGRFPEFGLEAVQAGELPASCRNGEGDLEQWPDQGAGIYAARFRRIPA